MKKLLFGIVILLISCSKQSDTPKDVSVLSNPLTSNSGDTVYYHIDVFPVKIVALTYSGNVYTSQPVKDDVTFYVEWYISTDTITRRSNMIIPFMYTQWNFSTIIPAKSTDYNTTQVKVTKIVTTDTRKFIWK